MGVCCVQKGAISIESNNIYIQKNKKDNDNKNKNKEKKIMKIIYLNKMTNIIQDQF